MGAVVWDEGVLKAPRNWLRKASIALKRSYGTGQQPVLPVPGGNLPEHRRVVGDDRDRHLVVGPAPLMTLGGLLVAEQNEHEVRVVQLGDP